MLIPVDYRRSLLYIGSLNTYGGRDMDDTPKTKTLGTQPHAKLHQLKGWTDYQKKAQQFAEAKEAAEAAKETVRQALKQKLGISEDDDIDFVDDKINERIRVIQYLEKKGRRNKSADLW